MADEDYSGEPLTPKNIKTINSLPHMDQADIDPSDVILVQDVSENEYKKATLQTAVDTVASPVRFTPQTLSDGEQSQARTNIGLVNINLPCFGVCSTPANEQEKTVSITDYVVVAGARVSIKFENGNTFGTAKGTSSNVIAPESAPTLNINGTGAKPIYVGGEPAGEGFINSGDIHDFVYDGTNWADVTADVIYKGGDSSSGYYEKKRNGLIEQYGKNISARRITFPVRYQVDVTLLTTLDCEARTNPSFINICPYNISLTQFTFSGAGDYYWYWHSFGS